MNLIVFLLVKLARIPVIGTLLIAPLLEVITGEPLQDERTLALVTLRDLGILLLISTFLLAYYSLA